MGEHQHVALQEHCHHITLNVPLNRWAPSNQRYKYMQNEVPVPRFLEPCIFLLGQEFDQHHPERKICTLLLNYTNSYSYLEA